ncbi:hypothetical protein CRI94_10915 [Longibacter salinarum]|uniref:Oxygen sensor histidine kinase NreB n=1 Tax=Longibacter salinarum TaxID=1850348 RepID=A0A2A8CX08_9BACT|nr:sensor histidine kinase [Longibacter salinarum]PEN13150.1 hypothetical protein CRI94_10915 [Longibacter salinarum]
MTAPHSSSSPFAGDATVSERVLLLLPGVSRTPSIQSTLDDARISTESVESIEELYAELRHGAGAVIVTDEAVTEHAVQLLLRTLSRRPPWSNLPIIVLTQRQPQSLPGLGTLDLFTSETGGNLTVLEYPVHPVTLTSVVQSALRARRRQYQVRDLLEWLEEKNAALEASEEALREANRTLEQRVMHRTEQVRELAMAVTSAEQRERNRISHILHDHLQQIIHSAKMWAELAISEPETRDESLPRIVNLLGEALDTTRSLTVDLNPPVLEKKGLAAALRWLSDRFKNRHGLTVHVELGEDVDVPDSNIQNLLFQLTRELLFNVVKHAGVEEATVRAQMIPAGDVRLQAPLGHDTGPRELQTQLNEHQQHIRIVVEDRGTGFDPQSQSPIGQGLANVRKRLELAGGHCEIETTPGDGTTITVTAPVQQARTRSDASASEES